jgi:hypothetical protein
MKRATQTIATLLVAEQAYGFSIQNGLQNNLSEIDQKIQDADVAMNKLS